MPNHHCLYWIVNCVNTETRQRFERVLRLGLDGLSIEERERIHQVLSDESSGKQGIRAFRHLFQEVPGGREAIANELDGWDKCETLAVPFYYEDQNGAPLSTTDFISASTGRASLIVMGDPTGPLRIGPRDMAHPEEWTMQKSNDVAHFLEVVQALSKSEWVRSNTGFTCTMNQDGTKEVLDFKHPGLFVITSVMVFIRQLFARRDRLFQNVMEAYERHANGDVKVMWVKDRFNHFTSTLDRSTFPFNELGLTGNELLELFFYGFGLIHRWNPDTARRFRDSKDAHGREVLVSEFQFTCQSLYAHAHTAGTVIAQDFNHWLKTGQAVQPDRVSIAELLP